MVPQTACAGNRRNVAGTAIIRLGLKKMGQVRVTVGIDVAGGIR